MKRYATAEIAIEAGLSVGMVMRNRHEFGDEFVVLAIGVSSVLVHRTRAGELMGSLSDAPMDFMAYGLKIYHGRYCYVGKMDQDGKIRYKAGYEDCTPCAQGVESKEMNAIRNRQWTKPHLLSQLLTLSIGDDGSNCSLTGDSKVIDAVRA